MKNRHEQAMILLSLVFSSFFLLSPSSMQAFAAGEGLRVPVDSVGYATTVSQMEAIVAAAEDRLAVLAQKQPAPPGYAMIGGICPHDDYIFAGPAYVKLLRRVEAPLVVIVGVSHKARRMGIKGSIVFDSFRAWKGPFGEVPVSSIREDLIRALPPGLVLVSDELHAGEHSIEGLIPFIQYPWLDRGGDAAAGGRKDVEILPVLITMLPGGEFYAAAGAFTAALHEQMEKRKMKLGRDIAILISADCVHYGDEGWGGRDYAPFGTGRDGYEKAVRQDIDIVKHCLAGRIDKRKIEDFRDRVDSREFEWPYRIPWCGVYSIPFGMSVIHGLCGLEGRGAPAGVMLDYSTSLDPGKLEVETSGLGATNMASLRHWVGYAAVGYW